MFCPKCGQRLFENLQCGRCQFSLLPVVCHALDGVKHYLKIRVEHDVFGKVRARAGNSKQLRELYESTLGNADAGPFELFNDECLIVDLHVQGQNFCCTKVSRLDREAQSQAPLIIAGHQPGAGVSVGDVVVNLGRNYSAQTKKELYFEMLHFVHQAQQSKPADDQTSVFLERRSNLLRLASHVRDLTFPSVDNWKIFLLGYAGQAIEELNLSYSSITNSHLELIRLLESLATVNLSFCSRITDQALENWLGLPRLNKLDLFNCPRITINGFMRFAVVRSSDHVESGSVEGTARLISSIWNRYHLAD